MAKLSRIRLAIENSLNEEEAAREITYRLSRDLIKACRRSISGMVRGDDIDISSLSDMSKEVARVSLPWRFGFVEDAQVEYAEAVLVHCTVNDLELPLPGAAELPERAYALGACDAIGEIRRIALEKNISDDIEGALEYLDKMRTLFSIIDGLTYPSGMINLKRKQDSARVQIDRTLAELTLSKSSRRING